MARLSILLIGAAVAFVTQSPPRPIGALTAQPSRHLIVDAGTNLLVVAPHPDDETLGAGGLMQRVHAAGGDVSVVYLTDGDGYPEGVRVEDHVESPTARDFRG